MASRFDIFSAIRGVQPSYTLRCNSMAMRGRDDLERGDKIILPVAVLDQLTRLHVQYPMLFRLENLATKRATHVGVSEFTADEGRCYIPHRIMRNLGLDEHMVVVLTNVTLPKATYVKLRPHSTAFTEISDPRAALEMQLRVYSCLTKNDTIVVHYIDEDFYLDVVEIKPADAVSVIETDCVVDFAPPADYVEPIRAPKPTASSGGEGKRGTGSAVIVLPDDDDVEVVSDARARTGVSAGAGAGSASPAVVATPGSGGGGTPGSATDARALAAAAARKRFASSSSVQPFTGTAHTLRASPPTTTSSAGAAAGGRTPLAPGASPKLAGIGGTVISAPLERPTSAKPRTLNKFEQAKLDKVFSGSASTLK